MESKPTGIIVGQPDGTQFELIRTDMFPQTRKLADAHRVWKFFEYLYAHKIAVIALDEHNQPVDVFPRLVEFLAIDHAQLVEEEKQLEALAAQRKAATAGDVS